MTFKIGLSEEQLLTGTDWGGLVYNSYVSNTEYTLVNHISVFMHVYMCVCVCLDLLSENEYLGKEQLCNLFN